MYFLEPTMWKGSRTSREIWGRALSARLLALRWPRLGSVGGGQEARSRLKPDGLPSRCNGFSSSLDAILHSTASTVETWLLAQVPPDPTPVGALRVEPARALRSRRVDTRLFSRPARRANGAATKGWFRRWRGRNGGCRRALAADHGALHAGAPLLPRLRHQSPVPHDCGGDASTAPRPPGLHFGLSARDCAASCLQ